MTAGEPAEKAPLGYNSEVSHRGITYHVQTELMDGDEPQINTLVFHDGALLHKYTSSLSIRDLTTSVAAERVKKQHADTLSKVRKGDYAP